MMKLDRTLQRRLSSMAAAERSPLVAIDRQRILARVREAESKMPSRRLAAWLGLAFAATAMVTLTLVARDGLERVDEPLARLASSKPSDAGNAHEDALSAPHEHSRPGETLALHSPRARAPRCAGEPLSEARTATRPRHVTTDLGERARFVLSRGAQGELARVEPCSTIFALSSGSVAVHARDLAGGELIVRTPRGDVVVHGTIFAVTLGDARQNGRPPREGEGGAAATLSVHVAEGEVGVVARASEPNGQDSELARLFAGDGVRVGFDGPRPVATRIRAADVDAITALVTRPPRTRAATPRGPVDQEAPDPSLVQSTPRHGEVLEGTVEIRRGHPLLRTPVMRPLRLEVPVETPLDDLP